MSLPFVKPFFFCFAFSLHSAHHAIILHLGSIVQLVSEEYEEVHHHYIAIFITRVLQAIQKTIFSDTLKYTDQADIVKFAAGTFSPHLGLSLTSLII